MDELYRRLLDRIDGLPGSRDSDRVEMMRAVLADEPETDARVDESLEDVRLAAPCVEALVRTGVDWQHRRLTELVDSGDTRFGAAWLLCRSEPAALESHLWESDNTEHIVTILRTIALAGQSQWLPALLELRREFDEQSATRRLDAVDAAIATVDPNGYAQALIGGEVASQWLGNDRALADFLCRHGLSTWVDVLAIFREIRDRQAFDLAALFATTTALTGFFDQFDEGDLDPGDATRWITDEPERIAFHLAICDDDDLAPYLVGATLQQALLERGFQAPALSGLPLSGPPPDAIELEEAFQIFDAASTDDPRHNVALIRSLLDLVFLAQSGEIDRESARPIVEHFSSSSSATKRVAALLAENRPLGRLDDWGCRGLHYARWQLLEPPRRALDELARGWFEGPLERSSLFAALFAVPSELDLSDRS